MLQQRVERFLDQVAATGSSAGLEELLQCGASFSDVLFDVSCSSSCSAARALLACTLLKVVVCERGCALSSSVLSALCSLSAAPPLFPPLRAQRCHLLALLVLKAWPRLLPSALAPWTRCAVLRLLRTAKAGPPELLAAQAQQCIEHSILQMQGANAAGAAGAALDWPLLRQAAKCGAQPPFALLLLHHREDDLNLLRLFAAARDHFWTPRWSTLVARAALSRVNHAPPRLCSSLLRRSCCVESCAHAALQLFARGNAEEEGGSLWLFASSCNARQCLQLLRTVAGSAAVAALALLHCDTEELRGVLEQSHDLWSIASPLMTEEGGEPALRLLAHWSAEVPPHLHVQLAHWLMQRQSHLRPAAASALAALITDARFSGPRLPIYGHWVSSLVSVSRNEDEAVQILGALHSMAQAGVQVHAKKKNMFLFFFYIFICS